jgi:alpha-tubulin suppressor-like RCC1 family protein
VGHSHCCARRSDGTVWCWGRNSSGQLGDETTTQRNAPVRVAYLTNVVHIATGHNHSCAIRQNGTTWCWGANGSGQLGDGFTTNQLRATQMPNFLGATLLTAGNAHTCAYMGDNTVRCWGRGTEGQLGNNALATSYTPVQVFQQHHQHAAHGRGAVGQRRVTTPARG